MSRDAMLLTSTKPRQIHSLALAPVKPGATAALRGLVDSKPRAMAIESQGPNRGFPSDGRARTMLLVIAPGLYAQASSKVRKAYAQEVG